MIHQFYYSASTGLRSPKLIFASMTNPESGPYFADILVSNVYTMVTNIFVSNKYGQQNHASYIVN